MTRNGKIARLPHSVRTELNERLRDGQGGQELLDWLNGVREAKALVKLKFAGVPFNPNNLSEWREGGYLDWLKQQDALELARQMRERALELQRETARGLGEFHENLSAVLTLELACSTQALLDEAKDPLDRWKRLRGAVRLANALRRGEQKETQTRIKREQWEAKTAQMEKNRLINEPISNFSRLYMNIERTKLERQRQELETRKAAHKEKMQGRQISNPPPESGGSDGWENA